MLWSRPTHTRLRAVSAKLASGEAGAIAAIHAQQPVSAKLASSSQWPGWRADEPSRHSNSPAKVSAARLLAQAAITGAPTNVSNRATWARVSLNFTKKW